jgi:phage I-like protein
MRDTRNNRLKFVALTGLPLPEARGEPAEVFSKWCVIIPDGHTKTVNGDEFTLDAESAKAILSNFARKGTDAPIDFEHQTLFGAHASPTGQAPAAGWIKQLRYEAGQGLSGLVEWVWKAAEMIRDRSYKYLSPALLIDEATRRPIDLHSAALTNKPAIPGFPELKAFSQTINSEAFVMPNDPQATETPEESGQGLGTLIVSIRELLSLPEDTSEKQVLQAVIEALKSAGAGETIVAGSVNAALGLRPGTGTGEVVAAIDRLKTSTTPPAEVLALRQRVVDQESEILLNRYTTQGKLTGCMEIDWRKRLTKSVEGFDERKADFVAMMQAMPVIIPQGQTTSPKETGRSDRATVVKVAAHEFDSEPEIQKFTSRDAYVNLKLHEAGLSLLTNQERVQQR